MCDASHTTACKDVVRCLHHSDTGGRNMLYRLDVINPDGTDAPVKDFAGVVLLRQFSMARRRALAIASESGCDVAVTRINNSGSLSHAGTASPVGFGRTTLPATLRPRVTA